MSNVKLFGHDLALFDRREYHLKCNRFDYHLLFGKEPALIEQT